MLAFHVLTTKKKFTCICYRWRGNTACSDLFWESYLIISIKTGHPAWKKFTTQIVCSVFQEKSVCTTSIAIAFTAEKDRERERENKWEWSNENVSISARKKNCLIFETDCLELCKQCLQDMGIQKKDWNRITEPYYKHLGIFWGTCTPPEFLRCTLFLWRKSLNTVQPSCCSITSCTLCGAYLWRTAHKSQAKLGKVTYLSVTILEGPGRGYKRLKVIEEHQSHHMMLSA